MRWRPPWLDVLIAVAGSVAFTVSDVTWWGCAITMGCFVVLSVALARATRTR